jgi:hypothetical protein
MKYIHRLYAIEFLYYFESRFVECRTGDETFRFRLK